VSQEFADCCEREFRGSEPIRPEQSLLRPTHTLVLEIYNTYATTGSPLFFPIQRWALKMLMGFMFSTFCGVSFCRIFGFFQTS